MYYTSLSEIFEKITGVWSAEGVAELFEAIRNYPPLGEYLTKQVQYGALNEANFVQSEEKFMNALRGDMRRLERKREVKTFLESDNDSSKAN